MIKFRPQDSLAFGSAGEHLVCADQLLAGRRAFLAGAGLPYDVIVEGDARLYRVQVKSQVGATATNRQKNGIPSYVFQIRRMTNRGEIQYADNEIDVVALVGLDDRGVGYVPASHVLRIMTVRSERHRGEYPDERVTALTVEWEARIARGERTAVIAADAGITYSNMWRTLKIRRRGELRAAPYLCDLTWERAVSGGDDKMSHAARYRLQKLGVL